MEAKREWGRGDNGCGMVLSAIFPLLYYCTTVLLYYYYTGLVRSLSLTTILLLSTHALIAVTAVGKIC